MRRTAPLLALLLVGLAAGRPAAASPGRPVPAARTVAPTAAAAAARPAVIGYVFARDRVLEPHELDRAGKLTHVNFAFANVVGGRVVEGSPRDAENLEVLTGLRQDYPHLKILVSVGGWTWSKGFSDAALTAAEPPPVRGLGRRLRQAPRPRRARRRLGVPGASRRRQPAPARGQGELHRADDGPARGPRPRGRRASREAPAPDVRGGCFPRLRRPHRDGEGAGRRRLREPDDVRLPRRQSGRAGRTPRELDARARPTRGSSRPPVRSTCSSRPVSPPRSSSSVCRSTGAPGKASSRRTAFTARAGRPRSVSTHRTPLSRRSPARTAGSASGTLRRRRRTCGTRRSRHS